MSMEVTIMCSGGDKPDIETPKTTPIIPDTPPETAEVSLGQEDEESKKKKRKASSGSKQLAIPLAKSSSGLGIP